MGKIRHGEVQIKSPEAPGEGAAACALSSPHKQDIMTVTCKHIATLTWIQKVVLTARWDRPMSLKSLEKDCWGQCGAAPSRTTTHVRMQERLLIPRVCKTPQQGSGWRRRSAGSQNHWCKQFHCPYLFGQEKPRNCVLSSHIPKEKDIPFWKIPRIPLKSLPTGWFAHSLFLSSSPTTLRFLSNIFLIPLHFCTLDFYFKWRDGTTEKLI